MLPQDQDLLLSFEFLSFKYGCQFGCKESNTNESAERLTSTL